MLAVCHLLCPLGIRPALPLCCPERSMVCSAARFSQHLGPKPPPPPPASTSSTRGFDGVMHRAPAGLDFEEGGEAEECAYSGKFLVGTSTDVWKRFLRITEEVCACVSACACV